MDTVVEQPLLRRGGMIAFVILLTAIPPLSTDLYVPCLPTMAADLDASQTATTLTQSLFFLCMAIGMLVGGAISDRIGRKPVLLVCSAATIVACVGCALTGSIGVIIGLRVVHGIVGGALVAIGTALVKDCFTGSDVPRILALSTAVMLVAPLVAPIIGTFMLTFTGWRGIFVLLAVLMVGLLVLSAIVREPLPAEVRTSPGVGAAMLEVLRFARGRRFVLLCLLGGMMSFVYMSYVNVASFVFIDQLGFAEVRFTTYFSIGSIIAIVGSLLYMKFPEIEPKKASLIALAILVVETVLMLSVGHLSGIAFLLSAAPWLLATNLVRPMVINLCIKDAQGNVGAASSFVNFGLTVCGGAGMVISGIGSFDYIYMLGILMAIAVVVELVVVFVCGKTTFGGN